MGKLLIATFCDDEEIDLKELIFFSRKKVNVELVNPVSQGRKSNPACFVSAYSAIYTGRNPMLPFGLHGFCRVFLSFGRRIFYNQLIL